MSAISQEIAAQVAKAKGTQVQAATEIWNARLEILRSIGDFRGVLEHLRTPVEVAANNCGCNNGCDSAVMQDGGLGSPGYSASPK